MKPINFRLLTIALIILLSACKKEKGEPEPKFGLTCGVSNPTEELPWLKAEITAIQNGSGSTYADFYVYRAMYKGNTVLWIQICCPACSTIPPQVKNCDGVVVGQFGTDIMDTELSDKVQIWRTENGFCQ